MQEKIEQSAREDDETLINDESLIDDDIFASLSESQMSFSLKKDTMIESYKIIKEISRGNMGIVYLANDINLNRLCAIKIILSHDVNTYTILLKRFKKEAELCAELNHPNIVKIYSVGLYDEHPYLVMEYVDGITLDKYCKENGANNYTLYAQLFIKIANALYDIHEHNIVHRDIKPSNILVRKNGEPVIMDFGIAKSVSQERTLTQDNQIVGTLHFMSPEQVRGKKLDGRSDIYSLGVMLYCIITKHFPFEDTSTFLIMKNITSIPPINPNTFNPDIPDLLQEVILKSMEKNPANRYATCKDFSNALEKYVNKTGRASYAYKTVIKYRSSQEKIQKNLIICLSLILCSLCIALVFLPQEDSNQSKRNNFVESYSIAINQTMKNAIAKKWNALEITAEEYTWKELLQKNTQYYLEQYYHILAQEYKNDSTEKTKAKKYYLKLWKLYENNDFAERLYEFLEEDVKNAIDQGFENAIQADLDNINKLDLNKLEENRDKECQKLLENQSEKGLLAIINNINNTELETKTIEEDSFKNLSLEQALMNIMIYLTKAEKWKKDEAIKRKADIYSLIIEKMIDSQIVPLVIEIGKNRKANKDTKEQDKKIIVLYYINRQYIEYAEKNYYQYWSLHPYNCEIFANILPLLIYHDMLEILQNRSIVTITDNEELKEVINTKENNSLAIYQRQCYDILQSYTNERRESLAKALEQRCDIIKQLNGNKLAIESYKRILQIQYKYLLAQFFISQSDEYIAEMCNKSKELEYTTSEKILKDILHDSKEKLFIRFLSANALNAMQTEEADNVLKEAVESYKENAISSLLAWIVISHRSDLLEKCNAKLENLYKENKFLYTEESLQLLYQFIDRQQKDLVNNRHVLELLNPKDSYTKLLKIACLLRSNEKEKYIDSLISIFDEYYKLIENNVEEQEVQQKMIFCLTIMNQYEENFSYFDFQNHLQKFLQTSNKCSYITIWEELSEREKLEYLDILSSINKEQFYFLMNTNTTGIPLKLRQKNKEIIIDKNTLRQIKCNSFTSRLENLKKLAYSFQNEIQNLSLTIIKDIDYNQYKQIAIEILQKSEKLSMDTLALILPEFNTVTDILIGKNLEPKNFRELRLAERGFISLKNFPKFYSNHTIESKVVKILTGKDKDLLYLKNMLFNRIAFLLKDPHFTQIRLMLKSFIFKRKDYEAEESGLLSFIVGLGTSQNKEYMNQIQKWYNSKNHNLQRATSFAYTLITEKDRVLKIKHNLEPKTIYQKQGAYLGYLYNFYTQFKTKKEMVEKESKFVDNQQAYYIFMNKLYQAMNDSKNSNNNFNISSFKEAQKLGVEISEETSLQNAITESFLNIMRKENLQEGIKQLEDLKTKYEKKSSYQAYNYLIKKYLYLGYKAISQENIELKNECLKVYPWDRDIIEDKEKYLEKRYKIGNETRTNGSEDTYEYNAYIRSHMLQYLFNTTD